MTAGTLTPLEPPDGADAPLRHPRLWWGLGALWLAALLAVSFAPAATLPPTGVSDKLEHALTYAGLTLWFAPLAAGRRGRAALALAGLGALIELLQPVLSDRLFELADIGANTLGAAVGLALAQSTLGSWMSRLDRRLGGRRRVR